jgi:hypothetical protein
MTLWFSNFNHQVVGIILFRFTEVFESHSYDDGNNESLYFLFCEQYLSHSEFSIMQFQTIHWPLAWLLAMEGVKTWLDVLLEEVKVLLNLK